MNNINLIFTSARAPELLAKRSVVFHTKSCFFLLLELKKFFLTFAKLINNIRLKKAVSSVKFVESVRGLE